MPGFRRASTERINAFEVGEGYLFRHYFEGETVFDRLKPYYDPQQYRFEVPRAEFDDLRSFLADNGYGLVAVDAPEEFAVVVRQYTEHPENVFKAAVATRATDGYNVFLLKDREAVERAVDRDVGGGATRLVDTDLEYPF